MINLAIIHEHPQSPVHYEVTDEKTTHLSGFDYSNDESRRL